ncbi:AAA family ATPase [Actinomycetaceae bacterium L2_0104]
MDFGPDISTYEGKRVGLFGGKFFPPHNGHLAMIAEAAKQVDVLFVVVQYDEAHEAALCDGTGFQPLHPRLRERWLSEIYRESENIRVFSAYEKRTERWLTDPDLRDIHRELAGRCHHIDTVFSGDASYTPYFDVWLPEAEHVVLDVAASGSSVHSSDIRRDGAFAHWEHLPEPVRRHFTKRVAFCGWESAGKSYTARRVAEEMGGVADYVPEYGRTYYEELNGYEAIAESQDALNTVAGHLYSLHGARGCKALCVDTDIVYTQFYHLKDFGYLHPALDELIKANADQIDEWIFLEPRHPLADDGSRFRYDERERLRTSDELRRLYEHYGKNLHVIDEADDSRRLDVAAELVRGWIG